MVRAVGGEIDLLDGGLTEFGLGWSGIGAARARGRWPMIDVREALAGEGLCGPVEAGAAPVGVTARGARSSAEGGCRSDHRR
jgi:hypothetical protein